MITELNKNSYGVVFRPVADKNDPNWLAVNTSLLDRLDLYANHLHSFGEGRYLALFRDRKAATSFVVCYGPLIIDAKVRVINQGQSTAMPDPDQTEGAL